MPLNQRSKGSSGEREFCKLLNTRLHLKKPAERNITQSRFGGADILTVRPFAIEIKRGETLQLDKWWQQAIRQRTKRCPIAILAFRQNRRKWRVRIEAGYIIKKRFIINADDPVEISVEMMLEIIAREKGAKLIR